VTEIRGVQAADDTYGQWIELYNASSHALELVGVQVSLIHPNGIDRQTFFVRDDALELAAGDRVVLGHQRPDDLPSFVDYGFFVDFHRVTTETDDATTAPEIEIWQPADLYAAATVEIEACGELVDRTEYDALPTMGTLALDGAIAPPSAEANDDPARWCNDSTEPPMSAMFPFGAPGTPGEANPPCL
jgi:hypothetical protein